MGIPREIEQDVLDIGRIETVQAILELVCESTGMGFAAVARVTEDRWVACSVLDRIGFGLKPGGELEVKTTICDEIRHSGRAVTIDHVREDAAFCTHATPAMYGFQSYISVPLVLRSGEFFGTLCAIDPRPARVSNPQTLRSFELWADLIAFHLDAIRRLDTSLADLRDARQTAELREQFIAVLGHDLRSPLAAIEAGVQVLAQEPLSDAGRSVLSQIGLSVRRGVGLVHDVLDFARGRLGGGIPVQIERGRPLRTTLLQVIDEQHSIHPSRNIIVDIPNVPALAVDPDRIGQVMANLLGNALTHGASSGPVEVRVALDGDGFELVVSNEGSIRQEVLPGLFKPFFRANPKSPGRGLGLGLYIASEIARAHGGRLTVDSGPKDTSFRFRIPAAVLA